MPFLIEQLIDSRVADSLQYHEVRSLREEISNACYCDPAESVSVDNPY